MGPVETQRRARLMATPAAVQLGTEARSIGAEIRAHFEQVGEQRWRAAPHVSCSSLSESIGLHGSDHGGDRVQSAEHLSREDG